MKAKEEVKQAMDQIKDQVRPFTMVDDQGLLFSMATVVDIIEKDIPGAIVECGCWKGGCVFGMSLIQKEIYGGLKRDVFMLDSFDGVSQPIEEDGPAANQYWEHRFDPGYHDGCRAPVDMVRHNRSSIGLLPSECQEIKGWFSETVPEFATSNALKEGISVLRIDCDWYEPVRDVLTHLGSLVNPGGVIIMDDYYAWDGCAIATHEWLANQKMPYRLRQGGPGLPWAWFEIKQARQFNDDM